MVYWLKVKQTREKRSFDEIIKELQQQKKMERENAVAFKEAKKRERLEKKEHMKQ
jgi:predicted CopG family antitoxin